MSRADAFGLLLAFIARLLTGAQGHWKGCPPKAERRICFANYQSPLDWVLIWATLPRELRATTRPTAARDDWTSGRVKHGITREGFNAVYVSRTRLQAASGSGNADQNPLEPLVEALMNGDSLVVKTRRGDHRSWLLAFFAALPIHYVLVANRNFDLFSAFIPVYAFLRRASPRRRCWGNTSPVTGAVGLLDRVAPLCFAAPVFFHSARWYFQLKA